MSLWISQRQLLLPLYLLTIVIGCSQALDCPWSSDPRFAQELSPESCPCSDGKDGKSKDANGGGGGNGGPLALSVDCVEVNFTMVAAALQAHGQVISKLIVKRTSCEIK